MAEQVHDAVLINRFDILTHEAPSDALVRSRMHDIIGRRAPTPLAIDAS